MYWIFTRHKYTYAQCIEHHKWHEKKSERARMSQKDRRKELYAQTHRDQFFFLRFFFFDEKHQLNKSLFQTKWNPNQTKIKNELSKFSKLVFDFSYSFTGHLWVAPIWMKARAFLENVADVRNGCHQVDFLKMWTNSWSFNWKKK